MTRSWSLHHGGPAAPVSTNAYGNGDVSCSTFVGASRETVECTVPAGHVCGRADEIVPGLAAEIADTLDRLATAWPADLPAGTIHADLFPDNVFYERPDRVSGLIDFYFACSDAFAYEIAICINAWCFEPDGQFNVTKARLMLGAYRKVRPFSDAELAALPLLCEGAALRFLLTRAYDWLNRVEGALVKPKDPLEYLHSKNRKDAIQPLVLEFESF